jgi:hypothetical protein
LEKEAAAEAVADLAAIGKEDSPIEEIGIHGHPAESGKKGAASTAIEGDIEQKFLIRSAW